MTVFESSLVHPDHRSYRGQSNVAFIKRHVHLEAGRKKGDTRVVKRLLLLQGHVDIVYKCSLNGVLYTISAFKSFLR